MYIIILNLKFEYRPVIVFKLNINFTNEHPLTVKYIYNGVKIISYGYNFEK